MSLYAYEVNGISYDYSFSNKTAAVRSVYATGHVNIPSSIYVETYYSDGTVAQSGTLSVVSIGEYAFRNRTGITKVTIPNSVTSIDGLAFYGCTDLTSIVVAGGNPNFDSRNNCNAIIATASNTLICGCKNTTIPNSVTSIGGYAFLGCSGLTSVTIPNSVTSIGNSAFSGCSGVTSVTIPNSVTTIGSSAFWGCTGLTNLILEDRENAIFGLEFPDSPIETLYLGRMQIPGLGKYKILKTVIIGGKVTSIVDNAFSGCSGLTSVTIPNSVTSIGDYAFSGCSGLTSVTIPNLVATIGKSAFSGCSGLTSVTIPNSVTTIGSSAFRGCTGLNEVNYNAENCTSMGEWVYSVFEGCSNLVSINIGSNTKTIPECAFKDCISLTEVTIPNSVTEIGGNAFAYCIGLTNLILEDGEEAISGLSFPDSPLETVYLGRTTSDAFASRKTTLKTLTIGDKVTSIANSAFYGCSGLTGDLTIPNLVTSIGKYVFNGCNGLTSVTIGNSVTSIGDYAFRDCSGLTGDLTIPNSVTTIGESAFWGCSGLTNLILEDGEDAISGLSFPDSPLETIYLGRTTSNAFARGKTTLKTLTIGDKVTSITNNAFNGCSGLTGDLTIPNSVTSIGEYAFHNCSGLNGNLTLGNSVATIGKYTFSGCNGLTGDLTIPNSVTSIGEYAFHNCSDLNGNLALGNSVATIGKYAFSGCSGLTGSLTIPNSVTEIAECTFSGCSGLISVTIPSSVLEILGAAFNDCTSLSDLIIEDGGNTLSLEPIVSQRLSDLKGQGTFYDSPLTTLYVGRNLSYGTLSAAGNSPFAGQKELVSVTIGKSVTSIRDKMFLGCSGLTNLEIPNSVTTIGESAFYGCIGMEEITIGNSVTSIGYETFYGCSGLISVTIPNSVTSIGARAFQYCSGLTSLTIGNSVTSIGESAFEDCSGLSYLILEDGEETISELYFPDSPLETLYLGRTTFDSFAKGKTTLKTLTIGDKVTSITNNAFNSCSGLTGDLTIPNSVTSIGEYAFHNCTGLNGNLTLGISVATIGRYAFRGCSGLIGDLTIPNSVTSVGESAFLGCSGLNGDLTLGNSVATIGRDAFLGCSGLTGSLTIPNSVTEIAESAFNGCSGLTGDFTIPNSVTSIGGYAFNNCGGLTSVTIPNSVTTIGSYAFNRCSGLTNLILEDGEDAISGLSFPDSPLETIYLGRTTSNAFASGKTTLKTLTIGDKVTSITNNAFNGCSGLTGDLIIPNSVTSIGESAFSGCSGLTGDLIIPNSVTSIGESAFSGCSGLTGDLTIPNSVTSIGESAFSGCSGLTGDLIIPNSVTEIYWEVFSGCSGLKSVTIPNSVTEIGAYAFDGCSGLTGDLTIPNSVTEIGSGAFYGCSGLTSVTIPNSITSIGNYAFGNCSGLAKVYCAAATPPDAYYGAFSYQYTTIDGAKAQTQLYVPASSVDLYKSTSPWSNFLIGQYGELKLYKSSYYTFDNYYTEDKTYKSMNGVTADGTSQIFIPIEENLSPSDFSIILTINGEPASIETAGFANQAIQKMPNGEKGIIYTAPKTFDESCMSNSYIVELTFDMINENGLTNIGRMPIEIEVHRPGLLMVHGLNSSSECWSAMQNDLLQSGLYRSAQINNINYSSSNLSSFDYNTHEAKVLEKGVKSMHNNLINNGIVSSKYDMIGHSMGGVLIRKYAQEVDGAADMVNSIITVNTPHHGSQLANIGMYVERIGSNYLSFLKPFIDYVTLQSAIYDLQIDGAAIKKLNQKNCSGIPVHVISSTIEDIDELYSRDIRQENVNYSSEDISNSLGNIIEVIEAPTEGNMKGALENFYKLIYSDKSDGIVSLSSQQGGLSGLCATNNIGQIDFSLPAPMWSWAHHCLNTKWDVTMNDIKALLCASKQGNGFTTGGFKYPLSAYSNTSDLGSLTFAEPQAGSFIKLSSLNTSDLQEVKVTVSDDVVSHCVYYILDNKLVSALDCDTARFIMPHWYEGGVTYYSLAKTNYGALITDSIYVDVKATDVDGNYLIYTPEELTEFAKIVNSDSNHTSYNAKLMADIDLENAYWTPICETGLYYKSYGEDLGYSGTFDGNGHVIRNLKVKSSTIAEASYGLFGTVSGTIKNLGIDGFKFEDGGKDFRAGAIVGQLITNGGKVSNCYVKNATIAPRDHVCGGIAGCAYEATIENCYVTNSTIIGYNKRYGHIVGDTRGDNSTSDRKGYVNNCYTDNSIVYSAQSGNISNSKQVDSEQFASGEVAYLLQGEQAEQIWGQNIDNGEEVQLLPTLYGAKVYYGYKDIEGTNTLVYTNDSTISENAPVFTQWKYYYNDTNWENSTVYTYVWDASNGNKEYLGSWPGTPMQKNEEGMWEISFETTDSLVDPMVIFSNGYSGSSNQTADLILINNGIYNFSGFTDITGIDVPHNPIMKIDVVNSMIIVTAERDDIVSITSADGRTRFYEVKMGKNYISDLPKGFYIVNKTKVVL